MRTSLGEERTTQFQLSGCMTSAIAFSADRLTMTQEPLQSLVVQTTRRIAARSLFGPEDAPSECSCFLIFSISEDPSASVQVMEKIRGHSGSPPHVLSCQGAGKDDVMVSLSLLTAGCKITNCFQGCVAYLLLVGVACVSVSCLITLQ